MLRLLVVLSIVAASTATAAGQFRASVDLVRIEALATDAGGRPIPGLTAADFRLTDNGAPQAIAVRPLADAEIDVIIALDTSLSVQGTRLTHLREATAAVLDRLTTADRATLIAFNHHLAMGPVDAAPSTVRPHLTRVVAEGATSLVDATTAALIWGTGRGRPILLLIFSDGRDTASWTRSDQALTLSRMSDAVVDAVVTGDLARRGAGMLRTRQGIPRPRSRVLQPTLSPSSPPMEEERRLTSERFLHTLTEQTSGRVLNGDAGGGLGEAFEAALAQFRSRYEITYTPSAPAPGWHAIDVKVLGRRGATVHARRGYQR
jgi:Ca-activated chloride channel family protein